MLIENALLEIQKDQSRGEKWRLTFIFEVDSRCEPQIIENLLIFLKKIGADCRLANCSALTPHIAVSDLRGVFLLIVGNFIETESIEYLQKRVV